MMHDTAGHWPSAAGIEAFTEKLAAWVATLSATERRLLAAAIRAAGQAVATDAGADVEGYFTLGELLHAQQLVGVLIGIDVPAVDKVRNAAQRAQQQQLDRIRGADQVSHITFPG
jgi:hypothetical protein